jgi:parallel beta-helix repeat protein
MIDMATTNTWPGDGSSDTPYRIENLNITSMGYCIRIANVTLYWVISGCYLNTTSTILQAIDIFEATNGVIEHCLIFGGMMGIMMQTSPSITVYNCSVSDSANQGINVDLWSHYVNISNCRIFGNPSPGITVYSSNHFTFEHSFLYENGQQGVYVNGCDYPTIHNNTVYNNENDGIRLIGCLAGTVTDNEVYGNLNPAASAGIYIISSAPGTVSGNTIYDNHHSGIYLSSSPNWKFLNNKIFNNTDRGIYGISSSNVVFSGNNISLNSWDANEAGIYLDGCHDLNATSNRIFDNHYRGVFIDSSDDILFVDNEVDRNENDGVYIFDLERCQIIGNHVFNNTEYGIYLQSAINATIDSNNVTYSGDISNGFNSGNIVLFDSHRATITNNHVSDAYGNGIDIGMTSYYHNISYNHAHDNYGGGVSTSNWVQNSTIHGNTLHDNGAGVGMTFAEYTNITDNLIYDCTTGIGLWWNVSYCNFRGNDIGWSSADQVSENTNPSQLCKDNVWDNNWWSDYSGTGNYTVSSISVDHYPTKSLDLVAAPDMEMEISSNGNTLEFGASALHPFEYIVWRNSSMFESGVWNGGNITLDIDGISAGFHDFWMIIFHVSEHFLTIHTYVNVTDLTSPEWTEVPANEEVQYGQPFYQNYLASDPSGIDSWWVNDTVHFSISGTGVVINNTVLDVGEYGLRIFVNDSFGNVQYHDILITVHEVTTITTTTTTSVTTSTTTTPAPTTSPGTTPSTEPSTSTTTTTSEPPPADYTTLIIIIVAAGGLIIIIIIMMKKR